MFNLLQTTLFLFVRHQHLLVYVDDLLMASSDDNSLAQLQTLLHSEFKIKNLGPARLFPGLEILRSSEGIAVC